MVDSCTRIMVSGTFTPFIRWELQNLSEKNQKDNLKDKMITHRVWLVDNNDIHPLFTKMIETALSLPCCILPTPKVSVSSCTGDEESAYKVSVIESLASVIGVDMSRRSIISVSLLPKFDGTEFPSLVLRASGPLDKMLMEISKVQVIVNAMVVDSVSKGHISRNCTIEFDVPKNVYSIKSVRLAVMQEIMANSEIFDKIKEFLVQVKEMAGVQAEATSEKMSVAI